MTIDRHFLWTLPASALLAMIVYFSFRHHVQHPWNLRLIVAAVFAAGLAPTILPDMAGRFTVLHFFPMVMFFPAALADATLYSSAGIKTACLLFVLPFITTLASVLFLWFAATRLMRRYERPPRLTLT